jgi:hypothetical protein
MPKTLLKIQREWYAKLEKEGFVDIEKPQGHLKEQNRRTIAFQNRERIREFFTELGHFLSNTPGLPILHQRILSLYCDGKHIKFIAESTDRSTRNIRQIIAGYRDRILKEIHQNE